MTSPVGGGPSPDGAGVLRADSPHDAFREALTLGALDALGDEEQRVLMEHASQCATCGAELAQFRHAAASLAGLAPASPVELERLARVRNRLVARAGADAAARRPPPAAAPASRMLSMDRPSDRPERPIMLTPTPSSLRRIEPARPRQISGWLSAAALLVAVVGSAVMAGVARDAMLSRDSATAQAERGTRRLAAMERRLADRERLLDAVTGPGVEVVELSSAGAAPRARMYWDVRSNRWTMFAHNLPAPAAGRTYQLWLVTPREKISAGTFTTTANGDAMVEASYPLDRASLRAIAVTDEPAGGVPSPTGPVVLTGRSAASSR